jgi:hypothetical protein
MMIKSQAKQSMPSLFNPDVAFKKSKKLDPLKFFISQPLWNANFHGLECCEMKNFNGPI